MDDSLSFSGLKGLWAPILVSHPKGGTIVVILVLLQVPELSLRPVCVRARAHFVVDRVALGLVFLK